MQLLARTPQQIGSALRRYRRNQRVNQTQLGQKTGLRQATISAVEAGEPGTEVKTLCEILAGLGLELIIRPRTKASTEDIEAAF
jgi:HTH-type transcriptional regulator / antitoxin HipB